jgi:hypothetical protein
VKAKHTHLWVCTYDHPRRDEKVYLCSVKGCASGLTKSDGVWKYARQTTPPPYPDYRFKEVRVSTDGC